MGNSNITICHFTGGGTWEAITIDHSALNGHGNHEFDVWPPVEDVTEGSNWPLGSDLYLNGCVLPAMPSPSASATASPSPTDTLPPTGAGENITMGVMGVSLIVAGFWMKRRSIRGRDETPA